MKKILLIIFSLLFIGVSVLLSSQRVLAADTPQNTVLPRNEVVNKDYFATGDTVTVSGTINGDTYVAGGNIIIDGTINGDLLAAGGMILIRGTVRDDIRVAGGQIHISGDVGRNITVAGGSVTIDESASISGSLTGGVGSLSLLAPLGKGAVIGGGQVTISNSINGDAQIGAGTLSLTPDAKINGDLNYWSEEEADIAPQAIVTGQTNRHEPAVQTKDEKKPAAFLAAINPFMTFMSFLSATLIGLLLLTLFSDVLHKTAMTARTKPLISFAIGFIGLVLFPFVMLFLFITLIGIPLSLILLALLFILMYIGKIIIGLAIGEVILTRLDKKMTSGWTLVAGLAVYYLITLIPFLGFLFWLISCILGFGAILLYGRSLYTPSTKKIRR